MTPAFSFSAEHHSPAIRQSKSSAFPTSAATTVNTRSETAMTERQATPLSSDLSSDQPLPVPLRHFHCPAKKKKKIENSEEINTASPGKNTFFLTGANPYNYSSICYPDFSFEKCLAPPLTALLHHWVSRVIRKTCL